MLVDHQFAQEREASSAARRRQARLALGHFLERLRAWTWFVTFTFRDRHSCPDTAGPALWNSNSYQPSRAWAQSQLRKYLAELQSNNRAPIAWVIVDGFGDLGQRYHCHALASGVWEQNASSWEAKA